MSTANDAKANDANGKGKYPLGNQERLMSFHKVVPVKKTRKPAAPAKKKALKKAAPKRRPVAHKG
jgi:hypothetical protein